MNENNSFSIVLGKTTINLIKGSPREADGKTGIIVLGKIEQTPLPLYGCLSSYSVENNEDEIGTIKYCKNYSFLNTKLFNETKQHLYEQNALLTKTEINAIWDNSHSSIKESIVMTVLEPVIKVKGFDYNTKKDIPIYFTNKDYPNPEGTEITYLSKPIHTIFYTNEKAFEIAIEDLIFCYNKALLSGMKKFKEGENKSISFASLGIGLPKKSSSYAALSTIIRFIKRFPNTYSCINLLIEEDNEFELYKNLLEKHAHNK